MVRASPTYLRRMRSATSRPFWGLIRTNRADARAISVDSFMSLPHFELFGGLGGVAAEGPGGRELAELVPDHVFRDEHRDELAAVVDPDGQSDHLRDDGRAPRPRLDDLALGAGGVEGLDLVQK